MSEFHIILTSNASRAVHHENTPAHFTNILPRPLALPNGWHVSLQSMTFDANICNLPDNIRLSEKSHFIVSPKLTLNLESLSVAQFSLRNKIYYTTESIISQLKRRTVNPLVAEGITKYEKNHLDRLVLRVRRCMFYIMEDVYQFLQLSNQHNHSSIYIGDVKYRVFNALQEEVELTSNANVYGRETQPSFIKVKLSELQLNLSGRGSDRELAVIPIPHRENKSSRIWYEVQNKEYFALGINCLSSITTEITDENNKRLDLISRTPTLIKLKFKKMIPGASIFMRVKSNDSTAIYADNHAARFRVQLPRALPINDGNWQVAISSVIYPAHINTCELMKKTDYWMELFVAASTEQVAQHVRLSFEDVEITDSQSLQREFKNKINTALGPNIVTISSLYNGSLGVSVKTAFTLRLSNMFATIFDIFPHNHESDFVDLPFAVGFKGLFPGKVDVDKCQPQNLLLMTDFTLPVVFGEKYCPILKMIPLLPSATTVRGTKTYAVQNYEFVNLAVTDLQTFQFQFCDEDVNPIKFRNKDDIVYINLLFRRI